MFLIPFRFPLIAALVSALTAMAGPLRAWRYWIVKNGATTALENWDGGDREVNENARKPRSICRAHRRPAKSAPATIPCSEASIRKFLNSEVNISCDL